MIERLPEPTKTPAVRPSWPEWDQTALAPPSAEQSYLRPFSRSTVRDVEHWLDDSVLLSRESLEEQGERCAMTTVHSALHDLVHLDLAMNVQDHREMQWNKSRHSHTGWLGVGLERHRIHCHQMNGGRSRLASLGSAMNSVPREMTSLRSSQVKNVRISFCTVVCTNFRTRHAIHVIYIKGIDRKASAKSSKVRTTKTGGSDPGNFGLSRPKLCSGSLPPCCSHSAESVMRAVTESGKFACAY